ncbi:MAG: amidohydrolase family protein [Streptosporangiaceae bacterium]
MEAAADVVLRGGRVIDPESGLDAVRDVAITGGRIAEVAAGLENGRAGPDDGGAGAENGQTALKGGRVGLEDGRSELDVTGLVVTAGFIDLHSHVNDLGGLRLQALDGVTTALELEAGVTPVAAAYRAAGAEGRPINYGFAASWALARMEAVAGLPLTASLGAFLASIGDPAWQRAAEAGQVRAMLSRLSADLADGALGIGILLGYAPAVSPDEYLQVAELAATAGVPTFTHARDLIELSPRAFVDGAEEIVRAAAHTGAHMHYCHVNSTSQRHIDRVLALVSRARAAGARVSTEAYPYGSGMTGIGAAFLAPERLGERGLVPSSLTYAPTGERVTTVERLRELRAADPGGLAIIDMLDEADSADLALLMRALSFPGGVVASDAMPLTWTGPAQPEAWPLPEQAITHPRTAGTFARSLRLLTRGDTPIGLAEALAKCSLEPARLLQDRVPAIRRKGRVQAGCDADLVVLDPDAVGDRATYRNSTRPSAGIRHVLVNGTFVVRDGDLVTGARPGRAVRAEPR